MTVRIEFDIDNAVFFDGENTYDIPEVVRTVEKVACAIDGSAGENGPTILSRCESILDSNGNRIGQWCIKERELL